MRDGYHGISEPELDPERARLMNPAEKEKHVAAIDAKVKEDLEAEQNAHSRKLIDEIDRSTVELENAQHALMSVCDDLGVALPGQEARRQRLAIDYKVAQTNHRHLLNTYEGWCSNLSLYKRLSQCNDKETIAKATRRHVKNMMDKLQQAGIDHEAKFAEDAMETMNKSMESTVMLRKAEATHGPEPISVDDDMALSLQISQWKKSTAVRSSSSQPSQLSTTESSAGSYLLPELSFLGPSLPLPSPASTLDTNRSSKAAKVKKPKKQVVDANGLVGAKRIPLDVLTQTQADAPKMLQVQNSVFDD